MEIKNYYEEDPNLTDPYQLPYERISFPDGELKEGFLKFSDGKWHVSEVDSVSHPLEIKLSNILEPGIKFEGKNTGIYSENGDSINFSINDINGLSITSSRLVIGGSIVIPSYTEDLNPPNNSGLLYKLDDDSTLYWKVGDIIYPLNVPGTPDPIRLDNGTAEAPSYSFSNSPDTGIYYNNSIMFSNNGISSVFIDSYAIDAERIRIRTRTDPGLFGFPGTGILYRKASPDHNLYWYCENIEYILTQQDPLLLENGTKEAPSYSFVEASSTGIYHDNFAFCLSFSVNSNERMRLNTSGLKISRNEITENPSHILELIANNSALLLTRLNRLNVASATDGLILYDNNTNNLVIRRNGQWADIYDSVSSLNLIAGSAESPTLRFQPGTGFYLHDSLIIGASVNSSPVMKMIEGAVIIGTGIEDINTVSSNVKLMINGTGTVMLPRITLLNEFNLPNINALAGTIAYDSTQNSLVASRNEKWEHLYGYNYIRPGEFTDKIITIELSQIGTFEKHYVELFVTMFSDSSFVAKVECIINIVDNVVSIINEPLITVIANTQELNSGNIQVYGYNSNPIHGIRFRYAGIVEINYVRACYKIVPLS